MIKITKRELEVNSDEFVKELYELMLIFEKKSPRSIGFPQKLIVKEFGLKITTGDFYKILDQCNLSLTLDFISFKTIKERYKQIYGEGN